MNQPTTPRVAIVTGGGRGIGAEISRRLAADGHAVAVVDLDIDGMNDIVESINDAGGRAFGIAADITQEADVASAVERIAAELGSPTILVNNAGILRDNLIFRMSTDDWDAVMNVHLRGAFLTTREVQEYMVKDGFGRIINLSSTGALGNRGQVNYSAAKAGLQGFTKTLAIELGKFGITANSVAPGFIETAMTRTTAERLGITYEEHKEKSAAKIPVGRIGQPADIANAVSFFADERSGFVSGQVLYVAGGPKA